jgi:serine phosphatase RsbU (regulator of sigma subunit)/anti-sigma regulatory factor (Ser/Thr protein kinase)
MTFLPHGTCLLWNQPLLFLQIISDAAIAVAYFTIAGTLAYFVRKRRDLAFSRIVWMFGSFIAACAVTHVFEILTVYKPLFWEQGYTKLLTAVISVATAIALMPVIPKALAMRNPQELETLNRLLELSLAEKDYALEMYRRERRVAREFQTASLPNALPQIPGLTFSSVYKSGTTDLTIGGDWYDAMRLIDGRIIISIGDVSGSGLNAAVIMSSMRQVLRGVAQLHPDPVVMLDAADRALRADHDDTIVTAFVAVVDPVSMTMSFASAGHPPQYLVQKSGRLQELDYRGMMLGLREYDDPPSQTIAIEVGSTIVLYTDGLTEATHDVAVGEHRLQQALSTLSDSDPMMFANALHNHVLESDASDDVAILTLHIESLEETFSRYRFYTSDADSARNTRLAFVADLEARDFSPSMLYSAELVFGELIGNCVRYAPGMVEVIVDWSGTVPVLHVSDQGPGFWHIPKLPTDVLSESGRGLFLVKKLTSDFTVSKKRNGGSHARAVLSTRGIQLNEMLF